eukprot:scaffold22596_cov131-Cylindrotheca_fusiformis.AAC.19
MKEAVVLILDANASMATKYDDGRISRFECAKRVARDVICNLMIQSKTNEVGVVVLKYPETQHHFYEPEDEEEEEEDKEEEEEVPFPNILEFGGDGETAMVARPTPNILRKIQSLQVSTDSSSLRGDFCDGIIVATDSLYQRTNKKKYHRRIVLITDGEHKVKVDPQQLSVVLDGLRDLECTLEVIGLDFQKDAKFDTPIVKSEPSSPAAKQNEAAPDEGSATDVDGDTDDGGDDGSDTEGEEEDVKLIKSQNESLLVSLAQNTGGYVMAAKELKSIFETLLGKRKSKSMRRKVEFQIAPGLTVEARFSLLLSKASIPSLKKRVVAENRTKTEEDKDSEKDQGGTKEDLIFFKKIDSYFDAENEEMEITDRGQAYRYGSDLVPMSGYDIGGLAVVSIVKLKILGYLPYGKVPRALCVGPPYILSGADSRKACAAISAIARALERKKHVAIATFVQTKNADPSLVGVFPYVDQLSPTATPQQPIHLVILKLPFRGDVSALSKPSFGPYDMSKEKVCDDLIDALRLEENQLDSTEIANPFIRSYWKTVIERVTDPNHELVTARSESNDDMGISKEQLKRAKPALEAFYDSFPLPPIPISGKK